MKVRVYATIDRDNDRFLDEEVKLGNYRNKSHAIEDAIKTLRGIKNDRKKFEK